MGKHRESLGAWLFGSTVLLTAIAGWAEAATAEPIETGRTARIAAFELAPSVPRLDAVRYTTEGLPRSAFAKGESVALGISFPDAGDVFAILVDSHGVVSLLGANHDGWIGPVEPSTRAMHEVVGDSQWSNGLPLGKSMVFAYVLSPMGRAQISAGLASIEYEEGIVVEASVPALSKLIGSMVTEARMVFAARQIELSFVLPKRTRGRGLGMTSAAGPAVAKVVDRDAIIRYFTGPRSRGIEQIRLDLYIPFAFDSAEMSSAAKRQLDEMAAALNDPRMHGTIFRVGGHTDRVGNRDYNMKLSMSRATSVREMLVVEYQIDSARLATEGFAFDRALDPAMTAEADATNRRVDFQLIRR
jgi:outer membrane protein OmpA-like peptidoglycan-associated protein